MIVDAKAQGVIVMALTNGASKDKSIAGSKYRHLGLDIAPENVVSSRDALLWRLGHLDNPISRFGIVDSFSDLPQGFDFECHGLTPQSPQEWLACDAIGFFGSVYWDHSWQVALEDVIRNGIKIMVSNPDVAAPLDGGFSREPAFWVAKAIHDMGMTLDGANVDWFGKPHTFIYDLTLSRLKQLSGQSNLDLKRIAMVGDTLHTDILGGHAAGLRSVLVTGHGLFRHGGAEEAMKMTGIVPDFIVETV
jgi:ribonucleotide monophosphatase NagD (HAD superfamily)